MLYQDYNKRFSIQELEYIQRNKDQQDDFLYRLTYFKNLNQEL